MADLAESSVAENPVPENLLRLAVLGDSIAYGTGAAARSDTLACRLTEDLAAAGTPAEARVFAWPGARSANLSTQVKRALAWRPDVAVVVIGANDLTHFVPPAEAAEALGRAVRTLRGAGVQVVVAPAPDLSVVPHVPFLMRQMVREASTSFRAEQARQVRAADGIVVDHDPTSEAFDTDSSLFAADRFHPSSAGYAVIARALAPYVRRAVDACLEQRQSA
jgi:lysophospholipase L1-like esterase